MRRLDSILRLRHPNDRLYFLYPPDKARVFAEIARVLKPGGQFSICDIVVQDLPDALRDNAMLYSACVAGAISEQE